MFAHSNVVLYIKHKLSLTRCRLIHVVGYNSKMSRCLLFAVMCTVAIEAAGPAWGAWGVWGEACTACTGAVSRGRTRVCIPGDDLSMCSGSRIELESCQNCTGQWSEWIEGTECSDTCGNCGRLNRTRQCSNAAGCPTPSCVGDATDLAPTPCDSGDVCLFPRPTCCEGTKVASTEDKRFLCKMA